jgi:hypothetical protein
VFRLKGGEANANSVNWQALGQGHAADAQRTGERVPTMATAKAAAPSTNGTETKSATIDLTAVEVGLMKVPIVGTAPIITNRFSEKAKRQMLDKAQGRKTPKQPKDPEAEYDAAFYRFEDGGFGIPVTAFKSATVGGARFFAAVTMTALRQFLFFRGEVGVDGQQLVRIIGEPRMREDVVRVGSGGTDLRYRPEFPEWQAVLDVVYVQAALTQGSVLSLINAGGLGIGVGDWRPERNGPFGTYEIDEAQEVIVVTK